MTEATHTHTHRERQAIVNRLARIEGHVKKIRTMIEEDQDCPAVLIQLAAVRGAINKVGQAVLEDHVQSCLLDGTRDPATEQAWAELKEAFDAFF